MQPGYGVIDDALSEHLELRGGLLFVRCFAFDLVEFSLDETTQLVGWPACGVRDLTFLEAGFLSDGVAFLEGHGCVPHVVFWVVSGVKSSAV